MSPGGYRNLKDKDREDNGRVAHSLLVAESLCNAPDHIEASPGGFR